MENFLSPTVSKSQATADEAVDTKVNEQAVKDNCQEVERNPAGDSAEKLNEEDSLCLGMSELNHDTVVSRAGDDPKDVSDPMEKFLIPANAVPMRKFSEVLVKAAQACYPDEDVDNSITKTLNQAVLAGKVIWKPETNAAGSSSFKAVVGLSLSAPGPELVMKVGHDLDLDHICTMEYIQKEAPDLPIPDIHGVLEVPDSNLKFIIMTRAQGQCLNSMWDDLDYEQKKDIQKQLNTHMAILRAITPPPLTDENAVLGGGEPRRCKQGRPIRVEEQPIANERQFNEWLMSHRRNSFFFDMIQSFMDTEHQLVMSHGDLNPQHIMVVTVDPEGSSAGKGLRISAILDWSLSGLYPEYWEYIKALSPIRPGGEYEDWWLHVPQVLGNWPLEYAVHKLIGRWLP